MKKIVATAGIALTVLFTSVAVAPEASARPAAGGGVHVGYKEMCKVNTNWFERHIMQMANTKWVLCRTIK